MDIFAVGAIFYLFVIILIVYYQPEVIVGIQLFSTPIIGNAISNMGLPPAGVIVIFSFAVISFSINIIRNKQVNILPSSYIEIGVVFLIS